MVNLAIEAVKEAGRFLLDNFGKIKEIHYKGDRNLATEIDREAEKIIVEKIKIKFPHHGILAEEGERKDMDSDYLWIVDPLDGTHNYIRNIDIFGVSVGVFSKGRFILGVIYMPSSQELYVAEEGGGSYKNGKRIYTSLRENLKECSFSFDSSIRYSPKVMLNSLGKLAQEVFNIRMFGSSARVLGYIAEGKLDGAIEYHDRPWDFAGGVCLIQEAGGKFTDFEGAYPTPQSIGYLTTNKLIHHKILALLRDSL
ncbi:MAG: inositol monophosphatase [Candidatus Omnitrophica bacterium]|nr:inositol monophosphatase [Candidatus Omnitrophota bacterium]